MAEPPVLGMSAIAQGPGNGCPTADSVITLGAARLVADPCGVVWWPDARLLAVADLHLEKGSSFARSGRLLPPHDTAATLERLEAALVRRTPAVVVCLGDSLHDATALERMAPDCRARLERLVGGVDWVWVAGNHDPAPPLGLGGRATDAFALGPLVFRHQAQASGLRSGEDGEVSGHFHPAAAIRLPGRRVRGRCFAFGRGRLILPAFGAFTGGLNVLDPAIVAVLGPDLAIHLIAGPRLHPFPAHRLSRD